ncbi:ATP-binding protein [bacterium]|nr:ATP-binding protein [bacterium]
MNSLREKWKTPDGKGFAVEIPSRLEELGRIERMAEKVAAVYCLSQEELDNLAIAVTEAVGNAIIHGNGSDPEKRVRIAFSVAAGFLTIEVADEGRGFDPTALSDPLLPENLMKESGRGIFILKSLMDRVDFQFTPNGTVVRMALRLKNRPT